MLDETTHNEPGHPATRLDSFETVAMKQMLFSVAAGQVEKALETNDMIFFQRGLAFLRANDLTRDSARNSARAIARMRHEQRTNPAGFEAWKNQFLQRHGQDAFMAQTIAQMLAPIPGSQF